MGKVKAEHAPFGSEVNLRSFPNRRRGVPFGSEVNLRSFPNRHRLVPPEDAALRAAACSGMTDTSHSRVQVKTYPNQNELVKTNLYQNVPLPKRTFTKTNLH